MSVKPKKQIDLDEILDNFGLGFYQVTICCLLGFVVMYSSISPISFAITAGDLKYRCKIPQCEKDGYKIIYDPPWLNIPLNKNNEPEKCLMYRYVSQNNINSTDSFNNSTCNFTAFDNSTMECQDWVFGETDRTIVNDFGIMCPENKHKLSFIGTINSIGQFIGIPISGFISDKYGRKSVMIVGSVLSAVFGLLRSFTGNYPSFLLFEFLDSMVSSGVYSAANVLGIELVSSKKRTKVNALMGCFYPFGGVVMGLVAYMTQDWRIMLRTLYIPGLLILGYTWYIPESLRWLQTQNRINEMALILSKIAKSNGKLLPSNVQEILTANCDANDTLELNNNNKLTFRKLIQSIITSKKIALRLICISFCWVTITLVYYGLSFLSVEFTGNKFVNFILVNAVELPAYLSLFYFLEHFPRRKVQSLSFLFSGISCLMVKVISMNYNWIQLTMFLCSKFAICLAFNIMYMFTPEMFPTEFRMSMFGIASMFGRLGNMLAPQMGLLSTHFGNSAPIVLFGVMSFVAGGISLLLPETKDKELPDTVEQAELSGEVNIMVENDL